MRLGLSLVVGWVLLLECGRPAVACSPRVGVLEFAPPDGTRLPANGRVYALATFYDFPRVTYYQGDTPYEIDAYVRRRRLTTVVTTLSDARPGPVNVQYGMPLLQPPFQESQFETRVVIGETEDNTPPGEFSVEWLSSVGPEDHGFCSGRVGRMATLNIERPADDWGVLYFDFHDEAGLHIGSVAADASTRQAQAELPDGRDCITVTAVDYGGNRTSAEPVCYEGGCRCLAATDPRGASASLALLFGFALFVFRRRSPGCEPTT